MIANRGEIAVRILRTCKKLGIQTVCVFSEADRSALFVSLADEAHLLPGPPDASNTYLNMGLLIEIAKQSGAQAIHPGYGFLSENADFAAKCEENGILFVGPPPRAINAMGSKKEAKQLLSQKEPTVPLIPGYSGDDQTVETLMKEAKKVGFPLLIKASAGGGGKGMRVLYSQEGMLEELEAAKREAKNYFGDERVLLERYFENVRHIEIQIFGDTHGNVVHCFERDCSMQRRYQKVIEETPSPVLAQKTREAMCAAAVRIGKLIGYVGAGTVEFIVDKNGDFFFLEVNTRLQVEHPVTEMVTSVDLVEAQIRTAEGFSILDLGLGKLQQKGHAIEVRIYAEDPASNFFPCSGQILHYQEVEGVDGVRYDTGVQSGSEVSIFYDPMIAKLIVYGGTREEATEKLKYVLLNTVVAGLTTNIPFLLQLISLKNFENGDYHTKYIETVLSSPSSSLLGISDPSEKEYHILSMVSTLFLWNERREKAGMLRNVRSAFRNNPYRRQFSKFSFTKDQGPFFIVEYSPLFKEKETPKFEMCVFRDSNEPRVHLANDFSKRENFTAETEISEIVPMSQNGAMIKCYVGGIHRSFFIHQIEEYPNRKIFIHHPSFGMRVLYNLPRITPASASGEDSGDSLYNAPMHSKILKVPIKTGDSVTKGQVLIVVESMKMENKIVANADGKVELFVSEGEMVEAGTLLLKIE